ncbi:class I SAM-dependent methyltransferase [Chryseobacterium luteum]|uniref:class I SAM-dependent methyltransferase n=1 Tax=Chryseobacterium luteum TaxID=421531 RepID=UPI00068B9776|nr:class I SAM-dependent methyltransferase [Chryseobacterium luteum]
MTGKEAINLIKKAIPESAKLQQWADLGCGSGTFTNALAHLLPNGSHIYAVDNQFQNLPKIMHNKVSIDFLKADFKNFDFSFSNLDGILMANSLHYIEDKESLIRKLENYLSADKKFLIIEYDTEVANQWVPFPVSFQKLKELFIQFENMEVKKITERESVFGQGNLYAAVINTNNR